MASKRNALTAALRDALNDIPEWRDVHEIAEMILPIIGRKRVSDRLLNDMEDALYAMAERGEATIGSDGHGYSYRSPWAFWNGKHFLVRMTAFEMEQKVLIPGHRFIPFSSFLLHPKDTTLLCRGKPVPKRKVTQAFDDCIIYISLCGSLGATGYLQHELGDDALVAADNDGNVTLTAYDFSDVLDVLGAGPGYRVRCLNARDGIYELVESVETGSTLAFGPYKEAIDQLDGIFEEHFRHAKPNPLMPYEIDYAYRHMPAEFFDDPPFHFGGYLSASRKVEIANTPAGTVLWLKGKNPGLQLLDDAELPPSTPAASGRKQRGFATTASHNAGAKTAIYTFKVALDGAAKINRIIDIHGNNTWDDLHRAIFSAFDRYDQHLYSFFLTGRKTESERARRESPEIACSYALEDGYGEEATDASRTSIADACIGEGFVLHYLFDYGDCWWHEVTLQKVRTGVKSKKGYPKLTTKSGKSPPQYPDFE